MIGLLYLLLDLSLYRIQTSTGFTIITMNFYDTQISLILPQILHSYFLKKIYEVFTFLLIWFYIPFIDKYFHILDMPKIADVSLTLDRSI